MSIELYQVKDEKDNEAEIDEMWSFVEKKEEQRWLWYAIDKESKKILAYVLGKREDEAFIKLKILLENFPIKHFYTDNWGAYWRNLPAQYHTIGKQNTQQIERKNLDFRTRIKRLARKTICFSKSIFFHDLVIGLFINLLEFSS